VSNLHPALFKALDAVHAAYEQAAREETDARSEAAANHAAGRRCAYSHALKLLSVAMSAAAQADSPEVSAL